MQVSEAACQDVRVEFSKGENGNDASVAEFPTDRGRGCYQGGEGAPGTRALCFSVLPLQCRSKHPGRGTGENIFLCKVLTKTKMFVPLRDGL